MKRAATISMSIFQNTRHATTKRRRTFFHSGIAYGFSAAGRGCGSKNGLSLMIVHVSMIHSMRRGSGLRRIKTH